MIIKDIDLKQTPQSKAILTLILDAPPSEFSEVCSKIKEGKAYDVQIKPIRGNKSVDQVGAIWAKVGSIADAVGASKEEIYEECVRRYGPSLAVRVQKEGLIQLQQGYRLVDVKQEREDGTVFAICYKGLSQMNSYEASKLLDGVLSECKEMGLSSEIEYV